MGQLGFWDREKREQKLDEKNPYCNGSMKSSPGKNFVPCSSESISEARPVIQILVVYALDRDPRNSLNMGVMFFGGRSSAAQIGIRPDASQQTLF